MKKLDSFLREVMRVEPLGFSMLSPPVDPTPAKSHIIIADVFSPLFHHYQGTFSRKVLKSITLSNGLVIPAGVIIEVASYGAMNDPDFFSDPEVFDPLRFYKVREREGLQGADKAGAGATNQFVSVNSHNLIFGYGRHACPGRFFAANEIKMILGRALLNYDVKLVDGVKERYSNIAIAESVRAFRPLPPLCVSPLVGVLSSYAHRY